MEAEELGAVSGAQEVACQLPRQLLRPLELLNSSTYSIDMTF